MIQRVTKVMTGEGVLDLRSVLWIGVPAMAIIAGLIVYQYQGDKEATTARLDGQEKAISNLQTGVNQSLANQAADIDWKRGVMQQFRDMTQRLDAIVLRDPKNEQ